AARAGDVEAGPQPARTLQLVEPQRLARALHARRPEVAQGEEPRDQLRGVLGQEGPAGLGQLLHPLREPHRVALRRVVHAEVVADLADHHLARVEAHADGEADAARGPQLVRVASDLVTEMERRPARALGVVLVRDRRPKSAMMPSPVYWFTVPSKRCTPSVSSWKKRSMIRCHSSGSSCSASSIEPFTSAKSTVTCLRSPSSAPRARRIFSARCRGVYAR